MSKWRRQVVAGSMALMLILGTGTFSYADDLYNKQQELENSKAQASDILGKIIWADQQKGSVLADLTRIDSELSQAQNDLTYLTNRRDALEAESAAAEKRLKETEQRLDASNDTVNKRLRSLYENGSVSYLDVLFQGTSFSDFLQRFDLVKRLLNHDVDLLKEVKRLREMQAADQARIEQSKKEAVQLESQTRERQQLLASRQSDRKQLVQNLDQQKAQWQAAYDEQEAQSRQLESIIRQLQSANKGPSNATGKFGWPVPGYSALTDSYGWRDDPFGGSQKNFHGGIDIPAPTGTSIQVVDSGTVLTAEYSSSFGNYVLVDHGGGLATLYAHASKLLVSAGQKVTKGDVIAKVGTTGWSTGPHLHIEVRVNGERQNPLNYLP